MVALPSFNSVSAKGFAQFATGSVLPKTEYLIPYTLPYNATPFYSSFNKISQMFLGVRRSQFAVQ
jgi:hypothetical protein